MGRQPIRPAEVLSEPRPGFQGCQLWLPGLSVSLSLLWDSSTGLSRRCSSKKVAMSLAMASTSLGQAGTGKKGWLPQEKYQHPQGSPPGPGTFCPGLYPHLTPA